MTKHKWHDEIVAWASGAEIEYQVVDGGQWFSTDAPAWRISDFKFRVKKEVVIEVKYFFKVSYPFRIEYSEFEPDVGERWDLKITYQDGKAIKAELPT